MAINKNLHKYALLSVSLLLAGVSFNVRAMDEVENKVEAAANNNDATTAETPVAEEAAETPVVEEVVETQAVEEVVEAPAVEEVAETPAVEEVTETPVAEEVTETPVAEEVAETPVVEEVVEAPAVEEVAETPAVEEVTDAPVAEEVTETPVAEEVAETPVAVEETQEEVSNIIIIDSADSQEDVATEETSSEVVNLEETPASEADEEVADTDSTEGQESTDVLPGEEEEKVEESKEYSDAMTSLQGYQTKTKIQKVFDRLKQVFGKKLVPTHWKEALDTLIVATTDEQNRNTLEQMRESLITGDMEGAQELNKAYVSRCLVLEKEAKLGAQGSAATKQMISKLFVAQGLEQDIENARNFSAADQQKRILEQAADCLEYGEALVQNRGVEGSEFTTQEFVEKLTAVEDSIRSVKKEVLDKVSFIDKTKAALVSVFKGLGVGSQLPATAYGHDQEQGAEGDADDSVVEEATDTNSNADTDVSSEEGKVEQG